MSLNERMKTVHHGWRWSIECWKCGEPSKPLHTIHNFQDHPSLLSLVCRFNDLEQKGLNTIALEPSVLPIWLQNTRRHNDCKSKSVEQVHLLEHKIAREPPNEMQSKFIDTGIWSFISLSCYSTWEFRCQEKKARQFLGLLERPGPSVFWNFQACVCWNALLDDCSVRLKCNNSICFLSLQPFYLPSQTKHQPHYFLTLHNFQIH